jgi:F0F1-type ATP synthase assembly protein I
VGEQQPLPAKTPQNTLNLALASVAGLGGCLVLVVVIAALFGGLWLDGVLNTKPLFTLVLVIGSVPVGIFVMYRVAMRVINRSLAQPETNTSTQGEKQP